jgi:hypothetical protein
MNSDAYFGVVTEICGCFRLLENLPQFFNNFLPLPTVDPVTKIWKVIDITLK